MTIDSCTPILGYLSAIALCIGCVTFIVKYAPSDPSYPCSVSEISPDIPLHVKEQCRLQRRVN